MNKKFAILLGALSLAVVISACATTAKSARTPLVAPRQLVYEELNTTERFRKYANVGIIPFTLADHAMNLGYPYQGTNKEQQDAYKTQIINQITTGFTNEMKDGRYKHCGVINSDEEAAEYDLVIEGTITDISQNSVSVTGTMTETENGDIVVNFKDTKTGFWWSACQELGANIHDFLRDVY